jgi:hypothetical protein
MQHTEADPRGTYRSRLESRRAELTTLERTDRRISLLRFFIFLGGLALVWPVVMTRVWSWLWMLLPVAGFFALVWLHERVIRDRTAARRAVRFFEWGLARLDDRWAGGGVDGREFLDGGHPYADDLDLFGRGSLFELLCTARTRAGERTLARWLMTPAAPEEVRRRQEAVAELRPALDLREDLARLGEDVRTDDDPDGLIEWAEAPPVLTSRWPVWVGALLGLANFAALIAWLSASTGLLPLVVTGVAAAALALPLRNKVGPVLSVAGRPENELELLSGVLARLERERFSSPWLLELHSALETGGVPPSKRIARLARLVELRDSRRNMIFLPLASLALLGTQLAFAIERWRAASGADVARWLRAVGRIEALSAVAGLAFERPDDVFPEILDHGPRFDGQGLGHPLLSETDCVRNDVTLGDPLRLLLISGSNMSGKSTLLRTVGVNAVLAQAGAPVRAQALSLSPLAIGASMNVRDSLRDGTSHFYAEIKRMRRLMDLGEGERPVLFLLDELLHGTNSHDRRIGAEALIRELLDRGGVGLVTTHDLALAEIAGSMGAEAANVHFEDRVSDGRMVFDYRLKPGVVKKSNALELMRGVGLNV